MARSRILPRRERRDFSKSASRGVPGAVGLLHDLRGSALLEFAIVLPLLVVFVVGIYDFSGAFNQKQKIEQAAQEGAIIAGAQPMGDIQSSSTSPPGPASLLPVVTAVFNSLATSGVLTNATACTPPGTVSGPGTGAAALTWTYTIFGCSSADLNDPLIITINRGWVCGAPGPACPSGPPVAVGTAVTIQYPYHWRFNSVIQLLIPGANYAAVTQLTESATVHNQM
ncbi:MAG: TadE/TadG family type IV pilus assembly protein [Terriglobales bacterium]|jgi:Flp pilus assembly protein TadG